MNKIMLRDPNNEEPENWVKFWKSFDAWFGEDALKNGFIQDDKCYYNSTWNGGTYEFNINYEKEYNIEYGISFPYGEDIDSYEEIKRFIEIAYKRWIKSGAHYPFTVEVNDKLKKFNLPYRLEKGILIRVGDTTLSENTSVNDIRLNKGEKLYTTYNIFTICEQWKQGGNSKVYRATDEKGIEVAIKVVHREKSNKFNRFINEVSFCEKSEHKNIIKIIDRGAIGEQLVFYVMPFAKESLRDRIRKKISAEDAEEIFINILEGLKYAHSYGAYHRDIKPENILFLDESNRAIIADFGIAHFCQEDMIADVHTKATDRMANFQYAAPEQRAKGMAEKVDGRADVYAVGLILNEMYTGNLVGGNNYKKISEIEPQYKYLDNIFDKLYCQQPEDRLFPVTEILSEIDKQKKECK